MTAKAKPMQPEDALDPSRALVPSVQRVNEMRVSKGFWPKVRRTAARIPFAKQVVSVYYSARDPETPMAAKGIMMGGLAYFILPLDAIPDIFAGIGFTDDAAVFAALMAVIGRNLKPRHRQAAREFLARLSRER